MKKLLFVRSVNFDPIKFSKENIMYDFYCFLARELSKYYNVEVLIHNKDASGIMNLVSEKNFSVDIVPNFFEYPRKPDILFVRGGGADCDCYVNDKDIPTKAYYSATTTGVMMEPYNENFKIVFMHDHDYNWEKKGKSDKRYYPMFKSCNHNIWKPLNLGKEYDIIHVANLNRPIKNHQLFFNTVREFNLKAVSVGYRDAATEKMAKGLNIEFVGHLPYGKINEYINKSKIAIVCTSDTDGPRVVQEILAAGVPIVAHSEEKSSKVYIKSETGLLSDGDNFSDSVEKLLKIHNTFDTRKYFMEHFRIDIVAEYFFNILEGKKT